MSAANSRPVITYDSVVNALYIRFLESNGRAVRCYANDDCTVAIDTVDGQVYGIEILSVPNSPMIREILMQFSQ